ncbi:hypothetical protein PHJA_002929300 [Phtheirospermum japonicum]|uniref:Uncharacterized protein n=1 Tax=Phtheirospermum japonicum TaxID=374723 RepID=A0A830DAV1_9LAMI|nr:hypothetical protein PHJA_002929300 [Phtheirospermum japonicum]
MVLASIAGLMIGGLLPRADGDQLRGYDVSAPRDHAAICDILLGAVRRDLHLWFDDARISRRWGDGRRGGFSCGAGIPSVREQQNIG